MPESRLAHDGRYESYVATGGALAAGEIVQLADGRAAQVVGDIASGSTGSVAVQGTITVGKTTGVVVTDGQPVYWDHSANEATYKPANDRDFLLGTADGDAVSADSVMDVRLNQQPRYLIELRADPFLAVLVRTAGTPDLMAMGGGFALTFSATAEAQKVDLLSQGGFAVGSNWIVEGQFTVLDDGDAGAIDFNIGVANATHASDADSITESCFLHLDGNALDLFAESDDGTTEVAATDTTVNIALGTPVHFVIDGRNPADIQVYVNGALVLPATTFRLDNAAGPLKLLAHLEKSSDDTIADYRIDYLRVRTAEN